MGLVQLSMWRGREDIQTNREGRNIQTGRDANRGEQTQTQKKERNSTDRRGRVMKDSFELIC